MQKPTGAETAASAVITLPRLTPHQETRPWIGDTDTGTMFSWECLYPGGAAAGITDDEERAVDAVNSILSACGGEALVQKCQRGTGASERDGYAYGNVVGCARVKDGAVVWSVP